MTRLLPEPFVYLEAVDPSILQEIRYAGHHNFVGRPIAGYRAPRCIVTQPTAQALTVAQQKAAKLGLCIKVYDGYRPQKAVAHFLRWCDDPHDRLMEIEFYPALPKPRIVSEGYLSPVSEHCYGGAVDLTLVPVPPPAQEAYEPGQVLVDGRAPKGVRFGDNSIDMGVGFDVFDPLSHTRSPNMSEQGRTNRALLCDLMQEQGFVNYAKEWWHFCLPEGSLKAPHDFDIC